MSLGTNPPCKKKAEEGSRDFIGGRPAAVLGYVAAPDCGCFGQQGVFAVAAGPFVVPDIVGSAGLGLAGLGGCGGEDGGVVLRSSGAAFAAD